jgi:hypothetical protein
LEATPRSTVKNVDKNVAVRADCAAEHVIIQTAEMRTTGFSDDYSALVGKPAPTTDIKDKTIAIKDIDKKVTIDTHNCAHCRLPVAPGNCLDSTEGATGIGHQAPIQILQIFKLGLRACQLAKSCEDDCSNANN